MVLLLPLLVWLMLLPCGDVVTIVRDCLAYVIATFVLLGRCCASCCTIDTFVAEGIIVPAADVITTIDLSLANVIAKWQMEWPLLI